MSRRAVVLFPNLEGHERVAPGSFEFLGEAWRDLNCGESPKKNQGFNQQTMENPFWNSMK